MGLHSASKFDSFVDQSRKRKIEALGDPLQNVSRHIDFAHLVGLIDELFPRQAASKGGCSGTTETDCSRSDYVAPKTLTLLMSQ